MRAWANRRSDNSTIVEPTTDIATSAEITTTNATTTIIIVAICDRCYYEDWLHYSNDPNNCEARSISTVASTIVISPRWN